MSNRQTRRGASRREVLAGAALLPGMVVVATTPACAAEPTTMEAAIRAFVGEAQVQRGRVKLEIPVLVENGNAVPLTVSVESPMTAGDFVKTIAVFNQKNPQPNVGTFHLGPRAGRASVAMRIRLATTQTITAVAQLSDGSFWSDSVDVLVTLAACLED